MNVLKRTIFRFTGDRISPGADCCPPAVTPTPPHSGKIAILKDNLPHLNIQVVEQIGAKLKASGFSVQFLSAEEVCKPDTLLPENFFLFIVPNCSVYPVNGIEPLKNFINKGSNFVVIGGPAFKKLVTKYKDRWESVDEIIDREINLPVIETISPSYKVYSVENIRSFEIEPNQKIVNMENKILHLAQNDVICPIRRPKGSGYLKDRKWRWIPLVNCFSKDRQDRGSPVSLLVTKRNIFGTFGFNDLKVFNNSEMMSILTEVIERIRDGVFLYEAGSEYFSYYDDEDVKLGANVINLGGFEASMLVKFAVKKANKKEPLFEAEGKILVKPSEIKNIETLWKPEKFDSETYIIETALYKGEKLIDKISHEITIVLGDHCKVKSDDFVKIRNGDFYLKSKKWYPMGVNFWPLYQSGLEPEDFWAHWLNKYYEPDEIERDLVRLKKLGLNAVSVQAKDVRNFVDFMNRCGKRNIKIHLFLRGADPVGSFSEKLCLEFIRQARLKDRPEIFAYDIAWEPVLGNYEKRKRWDKEWGKWIIERYGSIENAEKDWNFKIPRLNGNVTGPSDEQISTDGSWRVMVAAYRRFVDDLISKKYNIACRKIREVDPNHLISARTGRGGTGPCNPQIFPYDLKSNAKHLDFICPEGYHYSGELKGGITTAYARFVSRGKPVVWIEFGMSVWNKDEMLPDKNLITKQGKLYEEFYHMALKSGSNGMFPWWWPGGYRVNEKSDYGVINEDGSFRPSALIMKKYLPLFNSQIQKQPDSWITIDRDSHPGGYWHIYHSKKEEYEKLISKGKFPGLKTEGTGRNSADVPLIAVGNTKYNGSNPPKYLDGEFNWCKIKDVNGNWVEVEDGSRIRVEANKPVFAKVSVGNTEEATWLSGSGEGRVYLATVEGSDLEFKKAVMKDIPYLDDIDFGEFVLTEGILKETKVILQMTNGRAWFGEKLEFVLEPWS